MDASQLWFPEIVQLGRNTSFASFYVLKVSEIIRNTRKHRFGSNGLEWMLHNFGTPKYCIRARNMSFSSFTSRGFVKCSETLPNIILGTLDYNGCFTTLVPRNSAFGPEIRVLHLLRFES
jgi:hypothetical protein